MQRSQDQRIDLGELKSHVVKKIGVERSRRYFYYLSRFLSQKLTKSEFDKTCLRLLGRENLSLHNQLIRSILRNASVAKSPPPPPVQEAKPSRQVPEQSGSLVPNHPQNDHAWSNGVLPVSPRKVRSGIRDRKIRDRPSAALASNGKVEHMLQHQPICRDDNRGSVGMENGDLVHFDHHHHQRSGRYVAADERDGEFLRPVGKPRIPNKDQVAATAAMRDDDENQEEQDRLNLSVSPLVAPLGIPFRRTVPVSTGGDVISCYDSGGLQDVEMLRKRMENIAVAQGLGGVSVECANTLNSMLDVYLKKLIKSCIDLVGARSTNGDPGKQSLDKQQSQSQNKIVNGVVWPSNSLQIQTHNGPSDITRDHHRSVSLLDFRIAMELNPQKLGEDWPILRERISMRSFEEQDC
uniref:Transcriptional adapter 1 n=1 Tax=Noccaea caerulescens TaxID=107243 RepID=A0A1J3JC87_NOCCA